VLSKVAAIRARFHHAQHLQETPCAHPLKSSQRDKSSAFSFQGGSLRASLSAAISTIFPVIPIETNRLVSLHKLHLCHKHLNKEKKQELPAKLHLPADASRQQ